MIEVKGNTLIIKMNKKEDTAIFSEIIDLVNSKVNTLKGEGFLEFADKNHKIETSFKFNREEIYNEELRFHR